ncbi:MAG: hypothetical protein B6U95_00075 [Thermofilum sp. ex4484_82]|nr:MAG: hypothetical protein B6U95_00075 [Thermofilum sp. ex4484_82]OYT40126.1 MAG: hypothetical protein B6U96_00075 [Archaeoglobales archaeon ex4484_92]
MKKEDETSIFKKDVKELYNEVVDLKKAFNKLVDVLEKLEEKMDDSLQHVSQSLMQISKLLLEGTTREEKVTNYHI